MAEAFTTWSDDSRLLLADARDNNGFLDCQIARLEAGLAGHMAVSSATVSDNYRGTEFLPAQVEP